MDPDQVDSGEIIINIKRPEGVSQQAHIDDDQLSMADTRSEAGSLDEQFMSSRDQGQSSLMFREITSALKSVVQELHSLKLEMGEMKLKQSDTRGMGTEVRYKEVGDESSNAFINNVNSQSVSGQPLNSSAHVLTTGQPTCYRMLPDAGHNQYQHRRQTEPEGYPNMRTSLHVQPHRDPYAVIQQSKAYNNHHDQPARFPSVKLPSFTGKEDWSTWITQFEVIASRFHWTEEEMLDQLLPRLEGSAAQFVFSQLRKETINSYPDLVSEINVRFTPIETSRSFAAKLSRRRQRPGETVEEFAAEIKRLYDKAHKYRDRRTRQEDLVRRFLDGLIDDEMRFELEFSKEPSTIDEAVYFAVNWIQLRSMNTKRHATRSMYEVEEYDSDDKQAVRKLSFCRDYHDKNDKQETLQEMMEEIISRLDRIEETRRWKGSRAERRKMVICFNCQNQGHYARECPDNKITRESEKSEPLNMKGPNQLA